MPDSDLTRPTPNLTIGTWNCQMGVRDKLEVMRSLGCDVLVVPECADLTGDLDDKLAFAWKGRYARKGLGVLAFGGRRGTKTTIAGDLFAPGGVALDKSGTPYVTVCSVCPGAGQVVAFGS